MTEVGGSARAAGPVRSTRRGWQVGATLEADIVARLAVVVDPCSAASVSPMSIVELGLIRDVALSDGTLTVWLRLTSPSCMMVAYIAKEVTEKLSALPRVTSVRVQADAGLDWDPSMIDPVRADERRRRLTLLGP